MKYVNRVLMLGLLSANWTALRAQQSTAELSARSPRDIIQLARADGGGSPAAAPPAVATPSTNPPPAAVLTPERENEARKLLRSVNIPPPPFVSSKDAERAQRDAQAKAHKEAEKKSKANAARLSP